MSRARTNRRIGLLILPLALAAHACATGPDVFARHDLVQARRAAETAADESGACPVLLSNTTDQLLDVGYTAEGERSALGLLPAGLSLSFSVFCHTRSIEAFAVTSDMGLVQPGREYRTASRLDPAGQTRVEFTVANRVR